MEKVRLIRAGSLRFVLPVGARRTVIADDVGDDGDPPAALSGSAAFRSDVE